MSFWPFGSNGLSSVNKLLESPDLRLEDLLDNPDLLGELRDGTNPKLLEFIVKPENLAAMINGMVESVDFFLADGEAELGDEGRSVKYKNAQASLDETFEEEDTAEEATRRRYHVASQVLALDNWCISDLLVDQSTLLHLWTILDRPLAAALPSISYFTKINEQLLEARPDQMLNFARAQPQLVDRFLRHIEIPLLMDFLLKLTLTDKPDSPTGIVALLHEQNLITKLLGFLGPGNTAAVQSAAGDFLKAVITVSANTSYTQDQCIGPNELMRELVSDPCVEAMIEVMLQRGSGLATAVGIVIEIIRKNNSDYDPVDVLETTLESHPPGSRDPIFLGPMLRLFSANLKRFDLVFSHIRAPPVATAGGGSYESLGYERYKISELVAELLHCSNMKLLNVVGGEQVVAERDERRGGKERAISEALEMASEPSSLDPLDADLTHALDSSVPEAMAKLLLGYDPNVPPVVDSTTARLHTQSFFSQLAEINGDSAEALSPSAPPSHVQAEILKGTLVATEFPETGLLTQSPVTALGIQSQETPLQAPPPGGNSPPDPSQSLLCAPGFGDVQQQQALAEEFNDPEDDEQSPEPGTPEENDITPQNPFVTPSRNRSIRANPTVGDLYKICLLDSNLLTNIVTSFLRFPWNNFFHNVVFDLVQQVLQGKLHSFNSFLVDALFNQEISLTSLIILGHQRCTMSEIESNLRLGYMGHVILIAEEIVQFTQMYKPELISATIYAKLNQPAWLTYVSDILMKTREMYNCVLGGIRPTEDDVHINPNAIILGNGTDDCSDDGYNPSETPLIAEVLSVGGPDGPDVPGELLPSALKPLLEMPLVSEAELEGDTLHRVSRHQE